MDAPRRAWIDAAADWLHVFRSWPILAWPLIIGNLVAVWYGWTDYYAAQFRATPGPLWPFVSDSPNAVLFFAVALLLFQFRARVPGLDLVAWVANVKVGLWTVFVLIYYFEAFFRDEPVLRWILFWLHVGMVGQAFALHRELRRVRPGPVAWTLVAIWVVVGDLLDYGFALHPYLRGPAWPVVAGFTFALSAATLGVAWSWYRPRSPAPEQERGAKGR